MKVGVELKIKQLLDRGCSIRKIAKEVGVNPKTVQKVKKQGRYYINIDTKEIIFTSKHISEEQQLTSLLRELDTLSLSQEFGVNERTIREWKHKPPLVHYTNYEIDKDLLDKADILRGKLKPCKRRKRRPKIMGLYFLYQEDELMYVGRSKNISLRLYQHKHCSHLNLKGEYKVKIIKVVNEVDLEFMEKIYIQLLKPPLNIESKDNRLMGEVFTHLLELIPNTYFCSFFIG